MFSCILNRLLKHLVRLAYKTLNFHKRIFLSNFNGGSPVLVRLGSLVEAGPAKDRRLPEGRTARTRQVDFLQTSSFPSITVVIFRPVYLKLTSSLHFLDNNVLFDQSAGETLHCFHSVPLSFAVHQPLLCYILVLSSRKGGGPSSAPLKLPFDA